MRDELDVIIVDDDPDVCRALSKAVESFYTWGEIIAFDDPDQAVSYCLRHDVGVAVFIVDVFLGDRSGFFFLDAIEEKFPSAHEDSIIITGNATDDVVNMCVASDVNYLLEKPVKSYALQLAVRSIVTKYMHFAKRLRHPEFASNMMQLERLLAESN